MSEPRQKWEVHLAQFSTVREDPDALMLDIARTFNLRELPIGTKITIERLPDPPGAEVATDSQYPAPPNPECDRCGGHGSNFGSKGTGMCRSCYDVVRATLLERQRREREESKS